MSNISKWLIAGTVATVEPVCLLLGLTVWQSSLVMLGLMAAGLVCLILAISVIEFWKWWRS